MHELETDVLPISGDASADVQAIDDEYANIGNRSPILLLLTHNPLLFTE